MDVILEVADTFVGDYVYAWAHPARQALYDLPSQTNQTSQLLSSWAYEPSSIYFSLEPSQYAYMSAWDRENIVRQTISLFFITWIFGTILYFMFSTLSYYTIYDHKQMEHPKFLKNQVYLEMMQAITSVPFMSALTTPCWLLEVRGFTKLYGTSAEGPGAWYDYLQFPFFIILTDACIYLIHRGLHHPLVYKHLHKPHHKWIVPTPFASYAFHPVDGFLQSVPYHIFPMLFPLNKYASVFLFVFVNFWTILIHDGEYMANSPIINGAACHTLHHLYFNYNYGQYTTVWDRLGGSYRKPDDALFQKEAKLSANEWKKQTTEMEKIVKEVEGVDDRTYDPSDVKKTN